MPQYKYTAVTQDNQKMTGSLSAANENEARKELNELGLAILGIEETSAPATSEPTATPPPQGPSKPITPQKPQQEQKEVPEPTPAPPTQKDAKTNQILKKFEFEGIDKTGRKIVGTIPAADKLSALTRLSEEYQFDIKHLTPVDATQAEKDHAKQEGIAELKTRMQEETKIKEKLTQETTENKHFKEKQAILLQKVDYVLEKIKQVLEKFDQEIKPENKKLIQSYIDKLLRIKNSTNLEYIEHTAEELLKKVQDQEIFLHKENLQEEKTKLMIESQKLMSSLHTGSVAKPDLAEDLSEKLSKIRIPIFKKLIQNLTEKLRPDPEIASLKSIIKTTNAQIITYLKIWLKSGHDKGARTQVTESLKAVFTERRNLKTKLKNLKRQKSQKAIPTAKEKDTLLSEAANFIGWLLTFYLVYYFIAYYSTQKELPYELTLPWDSNLVAAPLIKYLVAIILLWYILLASKTKFAPKKAFLTPLIGTTGIILTVLIIFNF